MLKNPQARTTRTSSALAKCCYLDNIDSLPVYMFYLINFPRLFIKFPVVILKIVFRVCWKNDFCNTLATLGS